MGTPCARAGLTGLLVAVTATAVAAVAAVCVVAAAPVALAHAELVSSTPAGGATLSRAPDVVSLTFSETVRTPAFVEVTGPGGDDVSTGEVRVRDADVVKRLAASAGPGRYTLSYRITSADGHPITGSLRFTLTGGSGAGDGSGGTGDGGSTAAPAPPGTAAPEAPAPAPGEETAPAAGSGQGGGGLGTGQLVLLLGVLVVGLAALAAGTRRALRRSVAMVDDRKGGRASRG
jgi:copper resistance protein C